MGRETVDVANHPARGATILLCASLMRLATSTRCCCNALARREGLGGAEGAGSQEHRQPLRRARDGVLDPCQLARHAGLRDVRHEGGAEDGSGGDEDERAVTGGVLLRLQVEMGE